MGWVALIVASFFILNLNDGLAGVVTLWLFVGLYKFAETHKKPTKKQQEILDRSEFETSLMILESKGFNYDYACMMKDHPKAFSEKDLDDYYAQFEELMPFIDEHRFDIRKYPERKNPIIEKMEKEGFFHENKGWLDKKDIE